MILGPVGMHLLCNAAVAAAVDTEKVCAMCAWSEDLWSIAGDLAAGVGAGRQQQQQQGPYSTSSTSSTRHSICFSKGACGPCGVGLGPNLAAASPRCVAGLLGCSQHEGCVECSLCCSSCLAEPAAAEGPCIREQCPGLLKLQGFDLQGPGSLVASTMLQHLELDRCSIVAADGAVGPAGWQQVFPGPGQLPHLTSLQLLGEQTTQQQADIEGVVACCSNLKVLALDTLQDSCAPALAQLPGLTDLHLSKASDEECSALVQLTGMKQLLVLYPGGGLLWV